VEGWLIADPAPASPPPGRAICWRILLDSLGARSLEALWGVLDGKERERAERFRQSDDRRRFIAAHGGLRVLTAAALGLAPDEMGFTLGEKGKPACRQGKLEFSLSHSGGVVLIALSESLPVGVDVEEVRFFADHRAIALQYFHHGEAATLGPLEEPEATAAFFRCWTRKEAVIKALGLGLTMPLEDFQVSCRPGEAPRLLSLADYPGHPPWTLFDLVPAEGHCGALAIPARDFSLTRRTLDLSQL